LIVAMDATPSADIGTLAAPLAGDELSDPHCVKVVTDGAGRALYFSRARIGADRQDLIDSAPRPRSAARRHVGVYAYRPAALATFLAAPPSPLEQAERLEQLRALELGLTILVIDLDAAPRGIDTAADLEAARRRFGAK
jgi:3-deoxy-manno-octulosonate cytidylyltransferase (CMP-KDO synthetase)